MLKFFRRKRDDKTLAGNAEQEISTSHKLETMEKSMKILDSIRCTVERRLNSIPVDNDRRRLVNG